jgi:hypothetical protein
MSRRWFQLGSPLGYDSYIRQALEVLVQLGRGGDPWLGGVDEVLLGKQDMVLRWPLERTPKRTWVSLARRGVSSRWVTLRSLRILAALNPSALPCGRR